jgi:hypothetical protein
MCTGIGLNTRTGAAHFIVSMQSHLPAAVMQKPAGDLLKALVATIHVEASSPTRKAFSSAVGSLSKVASSKRVQWVATQALDIFHTGTIPLPEKCVADLVRR